MQLLDRPGWAYFWRGMRGFLEKISSNLDSAKFLAHSNGDMAVSKYLQQAMDDIAVTKYLEKLHYNLAATTDKPSNI